MEFYTNTHSYRQLSYYEIKQLEIGEKITICINNNPPSEMEFIDTEIIGITFNGDYTNNSSHLLIETKDGIVDMKNIYEVKEI